MVLQVVTSPLAVEEGGECQLGPEHLLLSDIDSLMETVRVELQGEPRHGVLQLAGSPRNPGQAFTVQDLKNLKVRSDIDLTLLPYTVFSLGLFPSGVAATVNHLPALYSICT